MRSELLLTLCIIPVLSHAQYSTKGACSPVLTGGSNTTFNFHCEGMSPAQAKQMLTILNQIARDRLDPQAAMKALDEIKALAAPLLFKTSFSVN